MKRDRDIKVQLCFVTRGKAYHTLRTATQAVARQIVYNIGSRGWNRPATERRDRGTRQSRVFWLKMKHKAYLRVKPIIAKVFPK